MTVIVRGSRRVWISRQVKRKIWRSFSRYSVTRTQERVWVLKLGWPLLMRYWA